MTILLNEIKKMENCFWIRFKTLHILCDLKVKTQFGHFSEGGSAGLSLGTTQNSKLT